VGSALGGSAVHSKELLLRGMLLSPGKTLNLYQIWSIRSKFDLICEISERAMVTSPCKSRPCIRNNWHATRDIFCGCI